MCVFFTFSFFFLLVLAVGVVSAGVVGVVAVWCTVAAVLGAATVVVVAVWCTVAAVLGAATVVG
jgi:hypothetical protein